MSTRDVLNSSILELIFLSGLSDPPCLTNVRPGLSIFQRVFVFRIFFKQLNDVWFDKANRP